jgi:hypothetical protein
VKTIKNNFYKDNKKAITSRILNKIDKLVIKLDKGLKLELFIIEYDKLRKEFLNEK